MYIVYGKDENGEVIKPIIYNDLDTILLALIKNVNTGDYNDFYQTFKIDPLGSYSSQDYNIYFSIENFDHINYTLIDKDECPETLLEYIYETNYNKVYCVSDENLHKCLLYCKTIYEYVENQGFTFNLDHNLFLCNIKCLDND
jgi:hypothetical protein